MARVGIHLDLLVKQRLLAQQAEELRAANLALMQAMAEVKALRGILPICFYCKKIKTEQGRWVDVGGYIHNNSEASVSHCLCPECLREHYPAMAEPILARLNEQGDGERVTEGEGAGDGKP